MFKALVPFWNINALTSTLCQVKTVSTMAGIKAWLYAHKCIVLEFYESEFQILMNVITWLRLYSFSIKLPLKYYVTFSFSLFNGIKESMIVNCLQHGSSSYQTV